MATKTVEQLKCACGAKLHYSGRGRKPKRCKVCAAAANNRKTRKSMDRAYAHSQNRATSRWGALWLYHGKAVRRDQRQVWGATGMADSRRSYRSGIFHPIGKGGLPGEHNVLVERLASGEKTPELAEARAWLKANPDWWRIEDFAHDAMSADVTESVVVHGESEQHPWAVKEPGYADKAPRRLVFVAYPDGLCRRMPTDWTYYEAHFDHNNVGGLA